MADQPAGDVSRVDGDGRRRVVTGSGHPGTASRNSERGVDEAERLGRGEVVDVAQRDAAGRRAGRRRAGRRARRSRGRRSRRAPGRSTAASSSAVNGALVGRRSTAARATAVVAGLGGVLAEQAGDVVVGSARALDAGEDPLAAARRRARTRCGRCRRRRSGGTARAARAARRSGVIAPSEKPTTSTGSSGRASTIRVVRSRVGLRVVRLGRLAVAEQVDADHRRGRRRRAAR